MRWTVSGDAGASAAGQGSKSASGSASRSMSSAAEAAPVVLPWSWPDIEPLPEAVPALPPMPPAGAPVTTTVSSIPIWRCPAIEHQPAMSAPMRPTSTVSEAPGARRCVRTPLAKVRSCTSVPVLWNVTTSASPYGTSISAGVKRIPDTSTVISVTSPDAVTSPPAAVEMPTAAGSAATPPATHSASTVKAAATMPTRRGGAVGTAATGTPSPTRPLRSGFSPSARRTRRPTTIARIARTRNAMTTPAATNDSSTRATDGIGSRYSTIAPLNAVTRNAAPRSSTSAPALAAAGLPSATTGSR